MIRIVKFAIWINFFIAVMVLVSGGILSILEGYSFFDFNEDLYGALDNNLRMMMFYIAITEIVILIYCFLNKQFSLLIIVGLFLILIIGSMQFYGEVNTVAIDEKIPFFLFYTGLSHILFGFTQSLIQQSLEKKS